MSAFLVTVILVSASLVAVILVLASLVTVILLSALLSYVLLMSALLLNVLLVSTLLLTFWLVMALMKQKCHVTIIIDCFAGVSAIDDSDTGFGSAVKCFAGVITTDDSITDDSVVTPALISTGLLASALPLKGTVERYNWWSALQPVVFNVLLFLLNCLMSVISPLVGTLVTPDSFLTMF